VEYAHSPRNGSNSVVAASARNVATAVDDVCAELEELSVVASPVDRMKNVAVPSAAMAKIMIAKTGPRAAIIALPRS
jgi:hypothetical protein